MKRFLYCLLILLVCSCSKMAETTIPNYPVYLELDLTFEDRALKASQAYKIYTQSNIGPLETAGFGVVLVFHGFSNNGGTGETYYAFDAACPFEAQANVKVEVDENAIYAICPKCGSKFEILNGIGNPVEGPSKSYLRQYSVTQANNKLYVRNY